MEDHRSHHHSHEEIESRPAAAKTQQATPLIGFNKTPAVSRMLSHLGTEPRLPQVLQAIPQRTTAPMNIAESPLQPLNQTQLLQTQLQQSSKREHFMNSSGILSQNPNSKRGESLLQQPQLQPGGLHDYFNKMGTQWSMQNQSVGGGAQTAQHHGVGHHMQTQEPHRSSKQQNRSSSQGLRGSFGRNISTTTEVLRQARVKVQQESAKRGDAKKLTAGMRTPGDLNETQSVDSNPGGYRQNLLNSNLGSASSINDHPQHLYQPRDREDLSLDQIRTPLKNVKSRLNRNRTTENQNSRSNNTSILANRAVIQGLGPQQQQSHFTTPEVIGRINANNLKQESSAEVINLRNLNQRVNGKHRLQPINLSSKISTDSLKKPIQSGSYVVEKPNLDERQPRSNPSRSTLQSTNIQGGPKASKQRQKDKNREANNTQQVIETGFKSSTNSKIPLLSKDRSSKRDKARRLNEENSDSIRNSAKLSSHFENEPDQTASKDELLVTFFDKSLVPKKRVSQEDLVIQQQATTSQGREDSHDSIIEGSPSPAIHRESIHSDEQVQTNVLFNRGQLLNDGGSDFDGNGSQKIFRHLIPYNQHSSQKHLSSLSTIQSREPGATHTLDKKLNGSMIVGQLSGNKNIDLSNLHPEHELYSHVGGGKKRKNKNSISIQRTNQLTNSSGRFHDELQSLKIVSQDSMKGENNHNDTVMVSALNHSMLVQECDLSQAAVSSSGAVELGPAESARHSIDSLNNRTNLQGNGTGQKILSLVPRDDFKRKSSPNSNMPQVEHVSSNSQVDKSYNLRGKLGSKQKVNMKQFFINNKQQKQKMLTPNRLITSQPGDIDRASQRSIVESTNAYIRAAQQQENKRIQYLQSAGTIPGSYQQDNGLTESDIGGGNRYDFLASSSVPYRAALGNNHLIPTQHQRSSNQAIHHQQQNQQHFPMPLQMHQSGRKLEPLAQYSLHQQLKQQSHTQVTEETLRHPHRSGSNSRSDLDPPDIALYQLRQKNTTDMLAPHPKFELKSRQSQFSNNSMNLPQVQGQYPKVNHQLSNGSYQTIAQQQSEASNNLKMALEQTAQTQSNILFSAEKTRYEQEHQNPMYMNKLDQSFTAQSNGSNAFNLATLDKLESSLRVQQPGARQKSSNNTRNAANQDENPFKKGPKLHLFKKSRRLKTSSAARQTSEDGVSGNEDVTEEQTITTGMAQQRSSTNAVTNKNGQGTSPVTSNTTIQVSNNSNVYSTIDQKQSLQPDGKIISSSNTVHKKLILASAPSDEKRQHEYHEGIQAKEFSRADLIASNASTYLNALREQRQNSEEIIRPTTSDFASPNSNHNTDAYGYQNSRNIHEPDRQVVREKSHQPSMFSGLTEVDGNASQKENSRNTSHPFSRQISNESGFNHDHNATAKFNVAPATSTETSTKAYNAQQQQMIGSRHSFYGQQQQVQKPKGNKNMHTATTAKKSIKLSSTDRMNKSVKNSQSASQTNRNQGNSEENSYASGPGITMPKSNLKNKVTGSKKMATSVAIKGVQSNDMNQTFNVNVGATSEGSPEARKSLVSLRRGQDSDTVSMTMIPGNKTIQSAARNLTSQNFNNNDYMSSASPYRQNHSRQKPQLDSDDRITRGDSAKTPYFAPTPQRTTGSNWGDQAYQLQSGSQQSATGNSVKTIKVKEAIQTLHSSDAIRSGLLNAANQQKKHAGDKLNIKIDLQKQNQSGRGNLNSLKEKEQKQRSELEQVKENEGSGMPNQLYDAFNSQARFDAQRQNLQSSNKSYRATNGLGQAGASRAKNNRSQIHNLTHN